MKGKINQFMEETLGRFHTHWILLLQCDAWIILCTAFQVQVEFSWYLFEYEFNWNASYTILCVNPTSKPLYVLQNDAKLPPISHFEHDTYWHWGICIALTNSVPQGLPSSSSPTTIAPAKAALTKWHSLKPRTKVTYSRWNCPDPLRGRQKDAFKVFCQLLYYFR